MEMRARYKSVLPSCRLYALNLAMDISAIKNKLGKIELNKAKDTQGGTGAVNSRETSEGTVTGK